MLRGGRRLTDAMLKPMTVKPQQEDQAVKTKTRGKKRIPSKKIGKKVPVPSNQPLIKQAFRGISISKPKIFDPGSETVKTEPDDTIHADQKNEEDVCDDG